MSVKRVFGGKVEIKALQLVSNPSERTETLARLVTPGGELTVLADGITPILHLGYLELKSNIVRGNHYHKARHERFYQIAGETRVFLRDMLTGEPAEIVLQPGDFALIPPHIAHAFLPLSPGHALEFAPEKFDAHDVFRVDPLQHSAAP